MVVVVVSVHGCICIYPGCRCIYKRVYIPIGVVTINRCMHTLFEKGVTVIKEVYIVMT